MLDIWTKLNEWSESMKEYMVANDQNVLLYTGLFLTGLAIFAIVFNMLNKDK